MSSAVGLINVQLAIQNYLKYDLPIVYDEHLAHWIKNPKLGKRRTMIIWHCINFIVIALYLYSIVYQIFLVSLSGSITTVNPEIVFTHSMLIILTQQKLATTHLYEWDPHGVAYMENSLFKILGAKHLGWPTRNQLAEPLEIMGYIMTMGFTFFPFVTFLWPILRSHDPVTTVLRLFVTTDILRRIIASFTYLIVTIYSAASCASMVLVCMCVSNIFEILTKEILDQSSGIECNDVKSSFEKFLYSLNPIFLQIFSILGYLRRKIWPKKFNGRVFSNGKAKSKSVTSFFKPNLISVSPTQTFKNVYRLHLQLTLLIGVSNAAGTVFVPMMACNGGTCCILGIFASIRIVNQISQAGSRNGLSMEGIPDDQFIRKIILYGYIVVFGTLTAVIVSLIFFFSNHASKSGIYSSKYIAFWRTRVFLPRVNRMQTRAMKVVAYRFGPFFRARRDTALLIVHQILDMTVSLLLGI